MMEHSINNHSLTPILVNYSNRYGRNIKENKSGKSEKEVSRQCKYCYLNLEFKF